MSMSFSLGIRSRQGFTLIEAMISVFIFVILMLAITSIFTNAFAGYRNTRAIQRDLENAQYALNAMAKELRTSTVAYPVGTTTELDEVLFYDRSQDMCIKYRVRDGFLGIAKQFNPTGDPDECTATYHPGNPVPLTTGNVVGKFLITSSDFGPPARMGKVTISLEISEGPEHTARIQTTTSLRDYGIAGL